LSKSPCWNRVKELEDSGTIEKYTAVINPAALGLTVRAIVQVVVSFDGYEAFEHAILEHKSVHTCQAVTGEFDYILEVYATSIETLDELLRTELSRLPGVQRFNTSIAMRQIKANTPITLMTGYDID
jgi:Lrp/AsnC family leucine-responsive transcriptional regulator